MALNKWSNFNVTDENLFYLSSSSNRTTNCMLKIKHLFNILFNYIYCLEVITKRFNLILHNNIIDMNVIEYYRQSHTELQGKGQ